MNKDISEFLEALGTCWRITEKAKNNIAKSKKYKVNTLFRQIDLNNKGFIQPSDLYLFLTLKNINPSKGQMFTIFKQLDSRMKGKISQSDLSDYFSTSGSTISSINLHSEDIDLDIKFFNQLIQNHRKLQKIKLKLSRFSSEQLFQYIDFNSTGVISYNQLKTFLKKEKVQESVSMDIIRFFVSKNLIEISYDCFISLIQPSSQALESDFVGIEPNVKSHSSIKNKSFISQDHKNKQDSAIVLEKYLKQKSSQNQARRQFIQEIERSRKQLMGDILKRKSPDILKSRVDYDSLKEGVSSNFKNNCYTESSVNKNNERIDFDQESLSRTETIHSNLLRLNNQLKASLKSDHLFTDYKQKSKVPVRSAESSFHMLQQQRSNPDLNVLIRKQQEEIQYQRSRRLKLENQIAQYKKRIFTVTNEDNQSPLFSQLEKLHPTISYLNYSSNCSPVFQDFNRPQSMNRSKHRQVGKIQQKRLYPKQFNLKLDGRTRFQDEVRRSRLDKSFAKMRLQKQMYQSGYLWR